jgi:16S rRNA (guanine527-N7)-methyltransferase
MAHKNETNHSPYTARQNPNRSKDGLRGQHKKPEHIFELKEACDRIADIFRNHDLRMCNHNQLLQFAQFYRMLMLNQETQNFTRLLKLRDIAIKHYIDSIIILQHTKLLFPLLDVGTGPGFPGIPLKIMFPKEKIILAEGVQKRVEFLKDVRAGMHLENLDIIGRNINDSFVYPVQGVITRAVEDIGNTLGNIVSSLQVGGRVYFMKGPGVDPEIPAALDKWGEYFKLVDDIAYSLPSTTHDRRLVIFEKIKQRPLLEYDPEDYLLLEELSMDERKRWSSIP